MTPSDLRAWQAHMGYTYDTAARALGVSRAAYADWIAGRSRTTGKLHCDGRVSVLAVDELEHFGCIYAQKKPRLAGLWWWWWVVRQPQSRVNLLFTTFELSCGLYFRL